MYWTKCLPICYWCEFVVTCWSIKRPDQYQGSCLVGQQLTISLYFTYCLSEMKQYSLFMHVASTLLSWKASHTLVAWFIMMGHVKKSYCGLAWPTVLWTHSPPVSGIVGTYADAQRSSIRLDWLDTRLVGVVSRCFLLRVTWYEKRLNRTAWRLAWWYVKLVFKSGRGNTPLGVCPQWWWYKPGCCPPKVVGEGGGKDTHSFTHTPHLAPIG